MEAACLVFVVVVAYCCCRLRQLLQQVRRCAPSAAQLDAGALPVATPVVTVDLESLHASPHALDPKSGG